MTPNFKPGMVRATDLTRAGKLQEATALIQSLLHPKADALPHVAVVDGDVIEGSCERLDGHPPAPPPQQAAKRTRKGLAETLRSIAAGGMPAGVRPVSQAVDLPTGAQFLALTHLGAQDSRAYRLYVPAQKPAGPLPLIVMLHGCTQSPEDFAIGTGMNALAEKFGCLVAWPAQPHGANAQKCWNWFRPEDQGRDRGEPALIAGIVRDVLRDYPADPGRVYVAGLSAGGAAAAIMAAAYPDIFAAVGVHSGLPVGAARDVAQAFAAMRSGSAGQGAALTVPTIVFHGLADTTVHPGNGEALIAQALRGRTGLKQTCSAADSALGRGCRIIRHTDAKGCSVVEHWQIAGAGHAWAGGAQAGSYTDPQGPDASGEMLRFFLQHQKNRS